MRIATFMTSHVFISHLWAAAHIEPADNEEPRITLQRQHAVAPDRQRVLILLRLHLEAPTQP